jgi:hypothetical protein
MADEATNIVLLGNQGDPVEVIVATGTAIAKNTLMQISASPKTCTATSGGGQLFIGILAEEKTTTDGKTKVAVITHCLTDLTCGAAETMVLGAPVITGAAANEVDVNPGGVGYDEVENRMKIVGIAQETVGNNGTGTVLINVGNRRYY